VLKIIRFQHLTVGQALDCPDQIVGAGLFLSLNIFWTDNEVDTPSSVWHTASAISKDRHRTMIIMPIQFLLG
jgi:hypothetical protein